ncbi:unnamed protein product [Nesidiocoris tenuis]|uniref:Ig-like domain-containing protein n=1 Tax=Nesidiocoris tenuis TaxID=355587 RepID=A0A6H5HN27_9HEMI|nr:unnamed protein product [Nesidiocoris tenuis]
METGMFFIRDGLPNSSKRKPQSSFLFYVQVKLPLPPQDGEVRGTEGNHRRLTDCLQPPEEPPVGKPSITGLKLQYRLGETLTANCTAPGSRPAANITWFVNNHLVS